MFTAKLVTLQVDGLLDQFVDADHFALLRFLAAEGKQVLHEVGCAFGFQDDRIDGGFVGGPPAAQGEQLRVAEDGGQRIINFVGDPGDGFAQRGELLGLDQVALQPFLLGEIKAAA